MARSSVGTDSVKTECIRPARRCRWRTPSDWSRVTCEHYNEVRLHSAIGYMTPADKLAGRDVLIFAERDRKLEAARERRRIARETARQAI